MTLGDIIEKILALFGIAPAQQRDLANRIKTITVKVAEMETRRGEILRANKAIGDKIADLKLQLKVEDNEHNEEVLIDQINELNKELDRKVELSRLMGENITAQRAIRAKCEQLLERLKNGADPDEIAMLVERVEDMTTEREETRAEVDKLDSVGKTSRKAGAKKSKDIAAMKAAILGEDAPAAKAGGSKPAAAPAAPKPAEPAKSAVAEPPKPAEPAPAVVAG